MGQQQQDPMTLNGGSILAMTGENCVAIAVDKRFGSGPQMVNISPRTVYIPNSNVLVAFSGLEGDVQSLSREVAVQVSSKISRNIGFGFQDSASTSIISAKSMSQLLSHLLYRRRQSPYFVEPIIAGIEKIVDESEHKDIISHHSDQTMLFDESNENTSIQEKSSIRYRPFLCAQDCIGAQSRSDSFVCSGAASKSLYGTAEAMWRPGLTSEELIQICGKAFLSALERDCLSGYGAIIYLIDGENGIEEIDLVSRND
jgi:20S proteasome subunit beta 3